MSWLISIGLGGLVGCGIGVFAAQHDWSFARMLLVTLAAGIGLALIVLAVTV